MLTFILHVHQEYSEWPLAAAPILIFMCSGMYTLLERVVGIPKIIFVIVVLRIAPSDGGNNFKPLGPQHPHCTCMKEFSVAFCNNVVKKDRSPGTSVLERGQLPVELAVQGWNIYDGKTGLNPLVDQKYFFEFFSESS